MKYVITDGTNYIDRDKNQNVTRNIKTAMIFDSDEKAHNFMINMKKTIKRFDWYIEQIKDVDETVKPTEIVEEKKYIKTKFEDETFNWESLIGMLEMVQRELPQYKDNLSIKQSENDKEICDIYHYVEFMNLNASQGYNVYKMLKERLATRRKIKNEMQRIHILMDATQESIENGELRGSFEAINNQHYNPRVLKELFEDVI